MVLDDVLGLISAYAKTASRDDYLELLEDLRLAILKLKQDPPFKESPPQRHTHARSNAAGFNRSIQHVGPSNVATRAYPAQLPTRSPPPQPVTAESPSEKADSPHSSVHESDINSTHPLLPGVTSPTALLAHIPAEAKVEQGDLNKLVQEIQQSQDLFRGATFIVSGNGHSETVNPDEIDAYFSHFGENDELSSFNLMPLLFSFDWSSTTLVLHSSSLSSKPATSTRKGSKRRWPLKDYHNKVILPYCSKGHWTLLEVDLQRNVIRQYNSLPDSLSQSAEIIAFIEERLKDTREQEVKLLAETAVSQQQTNLVDCGIFMVHNADCLASGRDPLANPVNGVLLRTRYLKRLLELGCRGRTEQRIISMVLPPGKRLGIKRRQLSPDMAEDEREEDRLSAKKLCAAEWVPPSNFGNEAAWLEERARLAKLDVDSEQVAFGKRERAEGLLRMIEAIGCKEVVSAWDDAVARWKSQANSAKSISTSTAETICRLAERTEVRSFKDRAILRVAKWIFAMKILQDVEKFREQGAPSRQYTVITDAGRGGKPVSRALSAFVKEVHPDAPEQGPEYRKYKKWWDEGQIWMALSNEMGPGILLLIPASHLRKDCNGVSNKRFTTIRSDERQPFAEALRRLRPDLCKTVLELSDQLEVLDDDITHLLGRLQLAKTSDV